MTPHAEHWPAIIVFQTRHKPYVSYLLSIFLRYHAPIKKYALINPSLQ